MSNQSSQAPADGEEVNRNGLLLALACSLFLAISAQWPGLTNPFVVNDDVRQQLYWMQRWANPQLYPSDLLGDYSKCYVPWGVQGLYRLGSLFIDPLYFSKLVAVALLTSLGGLVFLVAQRIRGTHLAWLSLAAFGLMPAFVDNISGGLARAFAAPLLVLFLYAQLVRSRPFTVVALLMQSLFIPYILPICVGASALQYFAWKGRLVPAPPVLHSLKDLLLTIGALGLVLWWQSGMTMAGFGPLPWGAEIIGRPEFGEGGRFAILPVPSVLWELFGRPWSALAPFREAGVIGGASCTLLLLTLMALGASRLDWRDVKGLIWAPGFLLVSSLLLFFAAKIMLLKLFIPSRYLEYTANILYCFVIPFLLLPVVLPFIKRCSKPLTIAILGMALVLGAIRQYGRELYDYSAWRPLCGFVQSTPTDSLFAGYPELMDNVLTFGQRNVFASFELAHPWSGGYWAVLGPRIDKMLRAYYGSNPSDIRRFCAQEGIDYFVVDRRHFEPKFMRGAPLFEPFRTAIQRRAEDNRPFALLTDSFNAVIIDENVRILDMRTSQGVTPGGQQ